MHPPISQQKKSETIVIDDIAEKLGSIGAIHYTLPL